MKRREARGDLAKIAQVRRVQRDVAGSKAAAVAATARELANSRRRLEEQLARDEAGCSRMLASRLFAPEMLLTWQASVRRAFSALQDHSMREAEAVAEAQRAKRIWNEAQVRAELTEQADRSGTRQAARARDEKAVAAAEDLSRACRATR